jgi:hypothetical protein
LAINRVVNGRTAGRAEMKGDLGRTGYDGELAANYRTPCSCSYPLPQRQWLFPDDE